MPTQISRALLTTLLAAAVLAVPADAATSCKQPLDPRGDVFLDEAGDDGLDLDRAQVQTPHKLTAFVFRLHRLDGPVALTYQVRVRRGADEFVVRMQVDPRGGAHSEWPWRASRPLREVRIHVPHGHELTPSWFTRGAKVNVTFETLRGFGAHVPADDLPLGDVVIGGRC